MKVPSVEFRYSWIYDWHWKDLAEKEGVDYPTEEAIKDYMKIVEKLWRTKEKDILAELSALTGLKWKEDKMRCYVVGKCRPFSDPLTIPVFKKYPDKFTYHLTHELIHQLFIQNREAIEPYRSYIDRKYKNETLNTRFHIPVHAIHAHIYMKFYGESELARDIDFLKRKNATEYVRSWEIVMKTGHQKILKDFRRMVLHGRKGRV